MSAASALVRDPVARILRLERVVPLDIEVGDLADDLIGVAFEEAGRAVLPLHGEGRGRLAVAKEGGDLAVAVVFLANGGQDLGKSRLGQNALQECDRVAGLDRL